MTYKNRYDYPYNLLVDCGISLDKVNKELINRLDRVLMQLSETYRSILLSYYKSLYSMESIAAEYQISVTRVGEIVGNSIKLIKNRTDYISYGIPLNNEEAIDKLNEIDTIETELIYLRKKLKETRGIVLNDYINKSDLDKELKDIVTERRKNLYSKIKIERVILDGRIRKRLLEHNISTLEDLRKLTINELSEYLMLKDIATVQRDLFKWGVVLEDTRNKSIENKVELFRDNLKENIPRNMTVKDLRDNNIITERTYNALRRVHINDLYELSLLYDEDIKGIRNIGDKAYKEIIRLLQDRHIKILTRKGIDIGVKLPNVFDVEFLSEYTIAYCKKNNYSTPIELIKGIKFYQMTNEEKAIRVDIKNILQKYGVV